MLSRRGVSPSPGDFCRGVSAWKTSCRSRFAPLFSMAGNHSGSIAIWASSTSESYSPWMSGVTASNRENPEALVVGAVAGFVEVQKGDHEPRTRVVTAHPAGGLDVRRSGLSAGHAQP